MNILIVLTSHDWLGDTGKKTGFWLEEFAAPYYVVKDAGAAITLASPKGGQPRRSIRKAIYPRTFIQRVQQVFVGDEQLQPGLYSPTAFVTEQGIVGKYGRNRQHHTERIIEALKTYLDRHRPLHAELRRTFVAV